MHSDDGSLDCCRYSLFGSSSLPCNGFKHRCSHMALGNACYGSRSSAGPMTIGSKCPRSFGREPNGPNSFGKPYIVRGRSRRACSRGRRSRQAATVGTCVRDSSVLVMETTSWSRTRHLNPINALSGALRDKKRYFPPLSCT